MIQTYNILSLLLDYPTAELWDSRADILPALRAEGVLSEALLSKVETFLGYVASFADAQEYLKAGLMPAEDELPDYLPMYLQYVANMDDLAQARAAIDDIRGVLTKMDDRFAKEQHPYESLIALLKES